MELTPIRVRGKKRKTNNNDSNPQPGAGRQLKSLRATRLSSQSRLDKRRQRLFGADPTQTQWDKKKKKKKNPSRLECLPVELLEKIFLYSLNVNFARCSPALRAAVSSERIYRVLILLVFWRDPLSWQGDTGAVAKILRPLGYAVLDEEERRILQSSVLRCRWCTVHRVLNQLPDLMNLAIQRYWTDAGIYMEGEQQARLLRFLAREDHDDKNTRSFQGAGRDTNHYTLSITPLVSVGITCHETAATTTYPILSLKEIPEKLLDPNSGSFDNDPIVFLEILRVAGGFNREEQEYMLEANKNVSLSRHTLQGGIHSALVQKNPRALTILLKIDEYFVRCENVAIASTTTSTTPENNNNNNNNINNTILYTIPPEHYRTAIRTTPHDPRLFQLLLRASAESVPADDAEITQWAMDLDDALGHWLLDLMLRLPRQIEAARVDPRGQALFYMGRGNGREEIGRRYLQDILGMETETDELGGWMGETEVDFEGLWMDGGQD